MFQHPLNTQEACAYLHNWLDFANVSLVDAELEDLATTEALLTAAGTAANLVSAAQIADADFERFEKVKWHNPLDT